MANDTVLWEIDRRGVATVTLNRPAVNNAYNGDLLQGLHAEGQTFLIIEHNLKVVRAFSDQVVVLDRGRLIAEGTADVILNSPQVVEAYLGAGHAGKGQDVPVQEGQP